MLPKVPWVPKFTSEEIECNECICGYSCGTPTALHRHLDKNLGNKDHAARSAHIGLRGKQWVASGSVKQRSSQFEKRIQDIGRKSSSGQITAGASDLGSPGPTASSQPGSPPGESREATVAEPRAASPAADGTV
ncbi:hypothetical protein T492DRAFT_1013789 [Pavlovales sp. CCMP2436]|nr:hypothetical protein T492DRAFT_1013789 [Pavlovales sp. CCMP2436]